MKDLILEIPNFVPEVLCNHLIKKFDFDQNKQDGVVCMDGERKVIPELKNCKEINITKLGRDWEWEDSEMCKIIHDAVKSYFIFLKKNFDHDQPRHMFQKLIECPPTSDYGYTIQKQSENAKYAWHYDGGFGELNQFTFLFVIIYLNTIEPGDGGETEFMSGRKVRPERGKIIMFPASWTYPHCGNKILKGDKYILTTIIRLNP